MGKITREQAQRLDQEIGEEAIMDDRSAGLSVRAICRKYGVTIRPLYSWLGNLTTARRAEVDGLCRRDRWNEATAFAAESRAAMADERLEALVDPDTGRMKPSVTREEVAVAKALAEQDRWQAASMDPAGFRQNGQPPQPTQVINVGQLFLQALETVKPAPKLAPPTEEAEYEVLDNPMDDDE